MPILFHFWERCSAMAYPKPPITEAVIELRFARPSDPAAVDSAARRIRDEYFYQDPENAVQFKLEPATQRAEATTVWQGIKLSSMDRTDSVFFRSTAFVCSRLAPYTGWEDFCARAVRGWEAWKKVAGATELSRIGVRYVNRIDIPVQNEALVQVKDYLNVLANSPEELGAPMSAYTVQIVRPLGRDDCSLVLNSGTVTSPLIGFASLALDLDIFREANLPRRDDELWALLNNIRAHKNHVFEICVTNKARALFSS
jgi:uncharacterized protein (TIGR04255 family)